MTKFLIGLKDKIKNQIHKRGWIVRQLKDLSAGVDIAYDLSNRINSHNLNIIFDCGVTGLEARGCTVGLVTYADSKSPANQSFSCLGNSLTVARNYTTTE